MEYLQKNLDAIKEQKQEFYKRIIDMIEKFNLGQIADGINYEYAAARNGETTLYVEKDALIYRLNSEFSPSFEAERWAEQFENIFCSITEIYGFGTGVFVRAIANIIEEDKPILVYEPSRELFLQTLQNCDVSDLLKKENLFIIVGEEELEQYKRMLMVVLDWNTVGFQLRVALPDYTDIFLEEYKAYLLAVKDANRHTRMSLNTKKRIGKLTAVNTIKNIRYLKDSALVSNIKEIITEDIPVILVAAGPSLDKNIDMLKEAKGKAIIVAVDSALNPLLNHGIVPDFSSTIDPNKSKNHYVNPISEEIPMLCMLESNFTILNDHKAKKLFMHKSSYYKTIFDKLGCQEKAAATGGSVATETFTALVDAGFKTIILIGQDLAIYGEHTHASAVKKAKIMITPEDQRIEVPGNNGGTVQTRGDFYYYLQWYKDKIAGLSEDITVINATEGGAFIEGTKVLTLKEAIEQYCDESYDIEKMIQEIPLLVKEPSELYRIVNEVNEELETIKNDSEEALNISYDLIRNAVQGNCQNSKAKQLEKKLSALNQKMLSIESNDLIDVYTSGGIVQEMSDIYKVLDNVYEDTRKTYDYSKRLYESMIPAATELMECLEETLEYIK